MRPVVAALVLPSVVYLAACVPIAQSLRGDLTEKVDRWVAEEDYGRALKQIDRVDPANPDYPRLQERRKEIQRLAEKYEQVLVNQAGELRRDEEWQKAFELYGEGLEKLPESERIRKARDKFLAERASRVEALRTEALISRGSWLTEELLLRTRIADVIPDDRRARQDLARTTRELEETSKRLYVCGQRARERKDTKLALRCLSLAEKLTPTTSVQDALARVKKEQSKRKAKTRRAKRRIKAKTDADRTRKLFDDYDAAYEEGDLLRAREVLAELKALQPKDDQVGRLGQELDLAVAKRVKRGMEESRQAYSQGKIQQALDNWQYLSKLDPENEDIKVHIARAERVLAKLRELSEKQSPASAPTESSAQ